jgi:hypothetical protein
MHKNRISNHSQLRKHACKRLRHSAAQNTARTYQIGAASNRWLGFTQTLSSGTATTGASSSVLYTLDAMLRGVQRYFAKNPPLARSRTSS